MTEKMFFKAYIKALEIALENEEFNKYYSHYDFIEDNELLKEIEKYENDNYQKYGLFFDNVWGYFDGRDHNILSDGKQTLYEYRKNLVDKINSYKILFNL